MAYSTAMDHSNATALVVDDSRVMRGIVRDMLQKLGFCSIEEAADGESALAKVRSRNFTLIVSDWHMEPLSGIELLREVRRFSPASLNRFILATTEKSWGSQTTARLDGAQAYLVKPFTLADLKTKIEQVLSR